MSAEEVVRLLIRAHRDLSVILQSFQTSRDKLYERMKKGQGALHKRGLPAVELPPRFTFKSEDPFSNEIKWTRAVVFATRARDVIQAWMESNCSSNRVQNFIAKHHDLLESALEIDQLRPEKPEALMWSGFESSSESMLRLIHQLVTDIAGEFSLRNTEVEPRSPKPPEGDWLTPMPLIDMANRLGNVGTRKARSILKPYGLRNAGNRQLWTARMDLMPKNMRQKLTAGLTPKK